MGGGNGTADRELGGFIPGMSPSSRRAGAPAGPRTGNGAVLPADPYTPGPMGGNGFRLDVPVVTERLGNGLRVVLSPDRSAPVVTVAVYYRVGIRLEPRGRSGFAHLFEHLMFQGSEHLGKMEFIRLVQENGGRLNGSTRFDFTNYFEVLPSHALELALWAEADRMRGPVITQQELDNQRDVVKNEIKVNVLNRPYGGFPWLQIPPVAYTNWHNSHNGYGDFQDLDAASLEDVREFFGTFYAPGNAVLVVVGDFDPVRCMDLVRRHFEDVPAGPAPPRFDVSEPRQEEERRTLTRDRLASRPATAVAWHVPPRGSPEFFAMGLLDQALAQGDDALLHRELALRRGYTAGVGAGMNFLGHMYNALTPLVWCVRLLHDGEVSTDRVVEAIDSVLAGVRADGLDGDAFARASIKARSAYYDLLLDAAYPGFGRADLLASFTLLDDDPHRINGLEGMYAAVSPDLVVETAREFLRPGNRTVLELLPGTADGAPA